MNTPSQPSILDILDIKDINTNFYRDIAERTVEHTLKKLYPEEILSQFYTIIWSALYSHINNVKSIEDIAIGLKGRAGQQFSRRYQSKFYNFLGLWAFQQLPDPDKLKFKETENFQDIDIQLESIAISLFNQNTSFNLAYTFIKNMLIKFQGYQQIFPNKTSNPQIQSSEIKSIITQITNALCPEELQARPKQGIDLIQPPKTKEKDIHYSNFKPYTRTYRTHTTRSEREYAQEKPSRISQIPPHPALNDVMAYLQVNTTFHKLMASIKALKHIPTILTSLQTIDRYLVKYSRSYKPFAFYKYEHHHWAQAEEAKSLTTFQEFVSHIVFEQPTSSESTDKQTNQNQVPKNLVHSIQFDPSSQPMEVQTRFQMPAISQLCLPDFQNSSVIAKELKLQKFVETVSQILEEQASQIAGQETSTQADEQIKLLKTNFLGLDNTIEHSRYLEITDPENQFTLKHLELSKITSYLRVLASLGIQNHKLILDPITEYYFVEVIAYTLLDIYKKLTNPKSALYRQHRVSPIDPILKDTELIKEAALSKLLSTEKAADINPKPLQKFFSRDIERHSLNFNIDHLNLSPLHLLNFKGKARSKQLRSLVIDPSSPYSLSQQYQQLIHSTHNPEETNDINSLQISYQALNNITNFEEFIYITRYLKKITQADFEALAIQNLEEFQTTFSHLKQLFNEFDPTTSREVPRKSTDMSFSFLIKFNKILQKYKQITKKEFAANLKEIQNSVQIKFPLYTQTLEPKRSGFATTPSQITYFDQSQVLKNIDTLFLQQTLFANYSQDSLNLFIRIYNSLEEGIQLRLIRSLYASNKLFSLINHLEIYSPYNRTSFIKLAIQTTFHKLVSIKFDETLYTHFINLSSPYKRIICSYFNITSRPINSITHHIHDFLDLTLASDPEAITRIKTACTQYAQTTFQKQIISKTGDRYRDPLLQHYFPN